MTIQEVRLLKALADGKTHTLPEADRAPARRLLAQGFVTMKDLPRNMRGGPTAQGFLAEITTEGRAALADLP